MSIELLEHGNEDSNDDEERDLEIFTVRSDYDYSVGAIILSKYRIIFLLIIILLLMAMYQIDPYSDAFETSFSLFILFGYWWLGLENIMALYCILPIEKAKFASTIIGAIYFIESIAAAVNPENVFGILFTLQSISTSFMSIYASCFLLYLRKMKRPLALVVLMQIFLFIAKLYALSLSFIYIHNDVPNHSTPTALYLTLFGATQVLLVAEIVIDKLDFITEINAEKQNIYGNVFVQLVFIILLCIVFVVSVILYVVYEDLHVYNEMDGYYPYYVHMEFGLYWDFPIVFAWIIWMLCSRIYIYEGKVQCWKLKMQANVYL